MKTLLTIFSVIALALSCYGQTDKKISAMDAADPLAAGDIFPIVQGGNNRKATFTQVTTIVDATLSTSGTGNLVRVASPTFTGTVNGASLTLSGTLTAATVAATTGNITTFGIYDTNASHTLQLAVGSDLTANRVLTLTTGDSARTITLSGDLTVPATGTAALLGTANTFTALQTINAGMTVISGSTLTIASGGILSLNTVNDAATNSNFLVPFVNATAAGAGQVLTVKGSGGLTFNPATTFLASAGGVGTSETNGVTRGKLTSNAIYFQSSANKLGTIAYAALTTDPTWTFPDVSGTVALIAAPQTLTNKTLSAPTLTGNQNVEAVPASDHTANGPTTSILNLGATIALMDLVYLGGSSKWLLTDADAESTTKGMLGICLDGGGDTDTTTVALAGSFVRDDTWNWTPGAILYVALDPPGQITATIPPTAGDVVRIVGYAITADVIWFFPSPDYFTN